ncbi:MAG: hypothetical protein MRY21_03110 [Simkaniaceae bacterium]|nr:hypothetical protein [Simkaniaceae bacterium]
MNSTKSVFLEKRRSAFHDGRRIPPRNRTSEVDQRTHQARERAFTNFRRSRRVIFGASSSGPAHYCVVPSSSQIINLISELSTDREKLLELPKLYFSKYPYTVESYIHFLFALSGTGVDIERYLLEEPGLFYPSFIEVLRKSFLKEVDVETLIAFHTFLKRIWVDTSNNLIFQLLEPLLLEHHFKTSGLDGLLAFSTSMISPFASSCKRIDVVSLADSVKNCKSISTSLRVLNLLDKSCTNFTTYVKAFLFCLLHNRNIPSLVELEDSIDFISQHKVLPFSCAQKLVNLVVDRLSELSCNSLVRVCVLVLDSVKKFASVVEPEVLKKDRIVEEGEVYTPKSFIDITALVDIVRNKVHKISPEVCVDAFKTFYESERLFPHIYAYTESKLKLIHSNLLEALLRRIEGNCDNLNWGALHSHLCLLLKYKTFGEHFRKLARNYSYEKAEKAPLTVCKLFVTLHNDYCPHDVLLLEKICLSEHILDDDEDHFYLNMILVKLVPNINDKNFFRFKKFVSKLVFRISSDIQSGTHPQMHFLRKILKLIESTRNTKVNQKVILDFLTDQIASMAAKEALEFTELYIKLNLFVPKLFENAAKRLLCTGVSPDLIISLLFGFADIGYCDQSYISLLFTKLMDKSLNSTQATKLAWAAVVFNLRSPNPHLLRLAESCLDSVKVNDLSTTKFKLFYRVWILLKSKDSPTFAHKLKQLADLPPLETTKSESEKVLAKILTPRGYVQDAQIMHVLSPDFLHPPSGTVVEYDGRFHYNSVGIQLGYTLVRDAIYQKLHYRVVVVRYNEWDYNSPIPALVSLLTGKGIY